MSNEELVIAIQNGDTGKLIELWQNIERLSKKFASKYARTTTCCGLLGDEETLFEDLQSCGYLAMVSAIQTFQPERETKFTTWFGYYFKREVYRQMGWHWSEKQDAVVSRDLHAKAKSLNEEIDEDGNERQDFIADSRDDYSEVERETYLEQLRTALDEALSDIPQQNADVLRQFYFDGIARKDIADKQKASLWEIIKVERDGIKAIKTGKHIKKLAQFTDYSDEDIYSAAIHGNGIGTFKNTGTSRVEYLAMLMDEGRKIV